MIVTINDARALRYCSRGLRKFFIRHNLDFASFCKNGIDSEILMRTNDSMAIKLVEYVNGKIL